MELTSQASKLFLKHLMDLDSSLAFFGSLAFYAFFAYAGMIHSNLEVDKSGIPVDLNNVYSVARKNIFKFFMPTLLIQIVFIIGMQFVLFHIVAIILCSIAPVLIIAEKKGVIKSFLRALSIKYADKSSQSGFSLFFTLAGSAAFLLFSF